MNFLQQESLLDILQLIRRQQQKEQHQKPHQAQHQEPTAAGAAAAKVLVEENIPSLANETGAYFQGKLKALSEKHGFISEVRGMGLLIAIEMSKEISGTIVSAALQKGLLINAVRPNMIRFMPPLNVSKGEIDEAVEILDQIFTESDN